MGADVSAGTFRHRRIMCSPHVLAAHAGFAQSRNMAPFPRRSPRVECSIPVRWTRRRQPATGEIRCCNIDGMFIATPHEADVGFILDLTIEMPWGPISCTAVPRFIGETANGRGIGVELHVMDRGDRELWNAHYRRALADHSGQ